MYQLKTGRQLIIQQEFHRRLLSEYNPHFTLDKYVAYLELKKIIGDIVLEQARYDSMTEKATNATNTFLMGGSAVYPAAGVGSTSGVLSGFGTTPNNSGVADDVLGLRRKPTASNLAAAAAASAPTQITTYLYAKTPMMTPQYPEEDDEAPPSISHMLEQTDNDFNPTRYEVTHSASIPANLPGRLLVPKPEQIENSRRKLEELHAKFFLELKLSHRCVKAFLIEKENAATEHIAELRKHSEKALAKLPPYTIPNIYRRIRNIALFRDLNTVGFQRVMQKYFQVCCTKSLEQQEKLRAADTIIANSHLCKPTFDADHQLDMITSIYATITKSSFEDARRNLDLAIERDLTTHRRIMPVTESYFYTSGFVHHQGQGSFALKLCSGLGAKPLTKKISALSHSPILSCDNKILPGGELAPKFNEAVRGDDVFVIQSMAAAQGKSMSTAIMQLALSVQTLTLASAARVTAVIPYMAYNSNPNASAAIAEMLMVNGCKQILTLDLRHDQVEGMFGNLPIYSVTALMEFISYLTDRIVKEEQSVRNLVVVSPDGDGVARARRFADAFSKNLNKVLFGAESNALNRPRPQITLPSAEDDPMLSPNPSSVMMGLQAPSSTSLPDDVSSTSPPRTLTRLQSTLLGTLRQQSLANDVLTPAAVSTDRVFIPIATALKRPSHECDDIDVIGDVKGQHCFIVDTIIDEAVNATTVAKKLKQGGATRVTVVATHALFSSAAALDLISQDWIDEIIITDSVSQDDALTRPAIAKKLRILSVAPLLAESIQRLHSDNCLSTLFDR